MKWITTFAECQKAAVVLDLQDQSTPNEINTSVEGCVYATNDWLSFTTFNDDGDAACGTYDERTQYDCICKTTGNILLTHKQIHTPI